MTTRIIVQQDITKPERTVFDVVGYLFAINTNPEDVMAGMSVEFAPHAGQAAAEMLGAAILCVAYKSIAPWAGP